MGLSALEEGWKKTSLRTASHVEFCPTNRKQEGVGERKLERAQRCREAKEVGKHKGKDWAFSTTLSCSRKASQEIIVPNEISHVVLPADS